MNTKREQKQKSLRTERLHSLFSPAIWAVIALVFVASPFYFTFFEVSWPAYVRYPIVILLWAVCAAASLFLTAQSDQIRALLKGAWFQWQKIAWPTRAEVMRSGWVVLAFVLISALLLWLLDALCGGLLNLIFGIRS